VDELPDGLILNPPSPDRLRGARIATYDDHRMAMAFAIAGLRIPGLTILEPGCVAKTYPGFWEDLERIRAESSA
jgi:3-phosphoshikimate 1-carboxyvinyltransferase